MQVRRSSLLLRVASMLALFMFLASTALAADAKKKPDKQPAFDPSACYGCHAPIKAFHTEGKHTKVGCNNCHEGLDKHLSDAKARPGTKVDPAACGACHQKQFETLYTMN